MTDILKGNEAIFDEKAVEFLKALAAEGQEHLFSSWQAPGTDDAEKKRLATQLQAIDTSTEGGLLEYIRRAKKLLDESKRGVNPMDGYTPSVPAGKSLDFGSDDFQQLENQGLVEAGKSVFVLVAGGLGERLGFSGIKIALPCETARYTSFIQLYIESILAIQHKARKSGNPDIRLPFVLMTSDDTHTRTLDFLNEHNYFGMDKEQVLIVKQEKVACLADSEARIALEKDDPFAVETKPHGHGDIHSLIHSSGMLPKWIEQGFKWLCIFQDTNALVFNGLLAALGVSASESFDMNSLAVPRKAKEAIGAIARLTHENGSEITINVEYNQLDPLLRNTINKDGDVNDETGFSPFPGNVNQLVFKLDSYMEQLKKTGGLIAEFVNPKYKDATKTTFQKSTRLECMMQDYPKTLSSEARVGFTTINQVSVSTRQGHRWSVFEQVWATYSPVKNSVASALKKVEDGCPPHSAAAAEADMYESNCKKLEQIGVNIGEAEVQKFDGMELKFHPRVMLSPSFALTFAELREKFPTPANVSVKSGSVLIVDGGEIVIEDLELDGALTLKHSDSFVVKDAKIKNNGWKLKGIDSESAVTEEIRIRGFVFDKLETASL